MAVQAQSKTPESQKKQQHLGVSKASLDRSSTVVPSSSSSSSSSTKKIHPIIHLQKIVGNQAVQQLIKSGKIGPKLKAGNNNTHHLNEYFSPKVVKSTGGSPTIASQTSHAKIIRDTTTSKTLGKDSTRFNGSTPNLNSKIQRMQSNHSIPSEIKEHSRAGTKPLVGNGTLVKVNQQDDRRITTTTTTTTRHQTNSPHLTVVGPINRTTMTTTTRPPINSLRVADGMVSQRRSLSSLPPFASSGMHFPQNISSVRTSSPRSLQMFSLVSLSSDPAEVEARIIAKRVTNMALSQITNDLVKPTATAATNSTHFPSNNPHHTNSTIHRNTNSQQARHTYNIPEVQNSPGIGLGSPLPTKVRGFMEPRFKQDFSQVRIHTGEQAAELNAQLKAQAFTVGGHIFFGKDQYRPDNQKGKELIAHELTHTIQQGATIRRSEEDLKVTHQSPKQVQRLGISDALDYFADKAYLIPGFRMFTIILGFNPINMSRVDRSAANVLRALIEFIPGGNLITQALDNYGVFDKVGSWVEEQLRTLGDIGSAVKNALRTFLDSLSWSDILRLGDVWDRAKRIFTDPIDRIINFGKGLVTGIINFIKDAILMPIAKLAEGTRGWDLLIAVLGKNPITGEPVPQTADTLIAGFMKLIGQEEVWENMKKAKAVPRAWAWFTGAMKTVWGFVQQIPTLAINAFKSLELADIVLLPRAFAKVASVFGNFIGSFISWAGGAVWNLLEIIFDVVSPGALRYIKRTGAALKNILTNPLPFVRNLVRAAKLGFQNFATNFGKHLKAGLIDWLTGSLAGVYIPKAFDLGEIVKFVFSVLGLSWQSVRQKLVKVVGETTVKAMETGFDIVKTLVTQGPVAAWDKIKDQLSNLKDMVIKGITDLVVDAVTKKAIPKLLAMFVPGAGFISAIISIYDTVMVFVSKLSKIGEVVKSFVDSIVAIARGEVGGAAKVVESTLAGILSLAINFLAGFAGLGKIADKLMGVIGKVRMSVDKGLDALINWIVTMARKLGRFVAQAGLPQDPKERVRLGLNAASSAVNRMSGPVATAALIYPVLTAIKIRYGFHTLRPIDRRGYWWVEGEMSPAESIQTTKPSSPSATTPSSADPKIKGYQDMINEINQKQKVPTIPFPSETNPEKYREAMRFAIATAYKDEHIEILNESVFSITKIPNRIRGDIFEVWLGLNNIMEKQGVVFKHNFKSGRKKRVADGTRGNDTLVDAKVRLLGKSPSSADVAQMKDYQTIMDEPILGFIRNPLPLIGPIRKIVYIFSDKKLIDKWIGVLKDNIKNVTAE